MPEVSHKQLLDWLDARLAQPEPVPEVLEHHPGLTVATAYDIQQALMQRRVTAGDRIVGYKAALTSAAMQAREGIDTPVLGTLLASRCHEPDRPVSLRGYLQATVEPEVGMVLARDLAGPGVTLQAAHAAIAGFTAAVEVGDIRTPGRRSLQHSICCNTFNGGAVFGASVCAPYGVDLRREGMVLACNGQHRASATAAEVLGNPLLSVVFIANKLAELGLGLKAGMVLLTGSIVASIPVQAGDTVQVGFSHLGELTVQFSE